MLDYRHNRLDYGELLRPPQGYVLDRALATSFSLDLETLLSIPVALHFAQGLDGPLAVERFPILEGIERASSTVRVYVQNGGILVPRQHNALYAFVEPMVQTVRPRSPFESFHPKIWLIRYVAKDADDTRYRVLVGSRNLTFHRSWDIAAHFDGRPGAEQIDGNDALVRLVDILHAASPIEDASRWQDDLARVVFDSPPGFDAPPEFVLSSAGTAPHRIATERGERLVGVSPFVDSDGLTQLADCADGDRWLFGRSEEFNHTASGPLARYTAFQISPLVVDGEALTQLDEGEADIDEQNLHAKLFVLQKGATSTWHLGSANATGAGLERNVEMGVRLTSNQSAASIDTLLTTLLGTEDHPRGVFEPWTASDTADPSTEAEARAGRYRLRRYEHQLLDAMGQCRAHVTPDDAEHRFTLTLDLQPPTPPDDQDWRLEIRPFNTDATFAATAPGERSTLSFVGIPEIQLSRFVEVRLTAGGETLRHMLCKVDLQGVPDGRLRRIFQHIVSDQATFFRYLRFLLHGEPDKAAILDVRKPGSGETDTEGDDFRIDDDLFEQLLVAASRDPQRLREVGKLIRMATEEQDPERPLVPAEFLEFWAMFEPYATTGSHT